MISLVWLLMTGSFMPLSHYFYWEITKTTCLIKKNIFNSLICHRLESFSYRNQKDKWSEKKGKGCQNSLELKSHHALSSFHPQYVYFCHLCHLHSWRHHQISGSNILWRKEKRNKADVQSGILRFFQIKKTTTADFIEL